MKKFTLKLCFLTVFIGLFLSFSANSVLAQSSINGMIFDKNRRPVRDIDVELLDDVERLIGSVKTRGGGFYSFQQLSKGVYYINVRVAGTAYKRKRVRFDLGISVSGVEVKQLNIVLQFETKRTNQNGTTNGVVFAQKVPEDAKNALEEGIKKLNKKDIGSAMPFLLNAVQVFPEYFDALLVLGDSYLKQGKLMKAENAFERAVKVNPKSMRGFYALAVTQNRQKKPTEAVESLKKAVAINSSEINSYFLLAKIQRGLRQYNKSENNFLKAKKLGANKVSDISWNLALLYYHNLKKMDKAAEELELYLSNLSKDERKKNKQKISNVKKLIKSIRSNGK